MFYLVHHVRVAGSYSLRESQSQRRQRTQQQARAEHGMNRDQTPHTVHTDNPSRAKTGRPFLGRGYSSQGSSCAATGGDPSHLHVCPGNEALALGVTGLEEFLCFLPHGTLVWHLLLQLLRVVQLLYAGSTSLFPMAWCLGAGVFSSTGGGHQTCGFLCYFQNLDRGQGKQKAVSRVEQEGIRAGGEKKEVQSWPLACPDIS